MRRAINKNPSKHLACVWTQNVDVFSVQRSRYLPETYLKKQENAHYSSERYHYYFRCSSTGKFLNVLNNSQR